MYDAALFFGQVAERKSTILRTLNLGKKAFYLCTIHRAENTDDTQRLSSLYDAVEQIASPEHPVVFPLHPRTRSRLEKSGLMGRGDSDRYIHFIEPLGFLDMIVLEKNATCILTDSGGVQKEAYFHRTPCVTLRAETEWVETVTAGWNQLADVSPEEIEACIDDIYNHTYKIDERSVIEVQYEGPRLSGYPFALNEVAVLKRDNSSMISIRVWMGASRGHGKHARLQFPFFRTCLRNP